MIASHIHDALDQVRKLQSLILEKRNFTGYSGLARITGGVIALAGAAVLATADIPKTPVAHLIGWGVVLIMSLAGNYGALFGWFLISPDAKRDFKKLMPAIDAIPALAVGAIMSVTLVIHHQYDLLFGSWMCLFGLTHVTYRLSLPKSNYVVGVFYIICGAVCLLFPFPFTNPWPMGLVFFAGELAGGIVLHRNKYYGDCD